MSRSSAPDYNRVVRRKELRPLGRLSSSLVLAFLAFSASLPFGGEHPIARLILTLSLVPTFLTILEICSEDRLNWTGLLANLYMAFGLIIPGICQCAFGEFPFYRSQYPETDTTAAAIIVLLFCGSMFLGRKLSPSTAVRDKSAYRTSPISMGVLAIFLSTIAWALAAKVGIQTFVRFRGDTSLIVINPVILLLIQLARSLSFTSFVISIYGLVKSKSAPLLFVPVAFCVANFFIVNYPPALPRYFILAYALTLVFVFPPTSAKLLNRYIAIFYPLALTTLFPFLSYITRGNTRIAFTTSWENYMVSSGDLDGFQSIVNVFRWVDVEGPQLGRQVISAIFGFIPRNLWEDKAAATGAVAAAANGYKFVNISAPLPAEFYSDFSWFGVLFGGVVVGWAIKRLDNAAFGASQGSGRFSTVLTAALVAGFAAILFRGSLLAVLPPCALVVLVAQSLRLNERRFASKG